MAGARTDQIFRTGQDYLIPSGSKLQVSDPPAGDNSVARLADIGLPYVYGDVRYDASADGEWSAVGGSYNVTGSGHSNDGDRQIIAAGTSQFRMITYDVDLVDDWIIEVDFDGNGSGNADGGSGGGVFWGIEVNANGRRMRMGLKTSTGTIYAYEGFGSTLLAPIANQSYAFGRSTWRLRRSGNEVVFWIDGVAQVVGSWTALSSTTANSARVAIGRLQSFVAPNDAYIHNVNIVAL